MRFLTLTALLLLGAANAHSQYTVRTYAGTGSAGYVNGDTSIDLGTTGVPENQSAEPAVYPNPTLDQLNFVVDASTIGSVCAVTDIAGKTALSGTVYATRTTVDLSSLTPGMYTFIISDSA